MNQTSMRKLWSMSVILIAVCVVPSLTYAKTRRARAAHVKPVAKTLSVPEDVYFNAEGREVSATGSLAANQMNANSIGRVVTLLFDSARVNLQTETDPLAASWTGTITIPINATAKPKAKSFTQDVRGSVNKPADARVVIVFELAGKSSIVEFPYGTKHDGDITRRLVSLNKPPSSGRYTASIWIFAERRNPKSAVLVDIDSIDINAR